MERNVILFSSINIQLLKGCGIEMKNTVKVCAVALCRICNVKPEQKPIF
jgi:hypothetical protein